MDRFRLKYTEKIIPMVENNKIIFLITTELQLRLWRDDFSHLCLYLALWYRYDSFLFSFDKEDKKLKIATLIWILRNLKFRLFILKLGNILNKWFAEIHLKLEVNSIFTGKWNEKSILRIINKYDCCCIAYSENSFPPEHECSSSLSIIARNNSYSTKQNIYSLCTNYIEVTVTY